MTTLTLLSDVEVRFLHRVRQDFVDAVTSFTRWRDSQPEESHHVAWENLANRRYELAKSAADTIHRRIGLSEVVIVFTSMWDEDLGLPLLCAFDGQVLLWSEFTSAIPPELHAEGSENNQAPGMVQSPGLFDA